MVTGFEVWRGKSPYNGAPLVAIVTLKTENRKTGDMAQLWILRQDMTPVFARSTGCDEGTCGTCPLKSGNGCYVNVGQAPLAVYRKWKRGKYPKFNRIDARPVQIAIAEKLAGKKIRLGAYGDPAMLPIEVIRMLAGFSSGHTGYTHQWKNSWCNPELKNYVMASCDNPAMQSVASALGWKTFRHSADGTAGPMEDECFSDSKGMQCADCLRCNGVSGNYVVMRHGATKNRITM